MPYLGRFRMKNFTNISKIPVICRWNLPKGMGQFQLQKSGLWLKLCLIWPDLSKIFCCLIWSTHCTCSEIGQLRKFYCIIFVVKLPKNQQSNSSIPLYDYESTTTFDLGSDSDEDELSNEAKRIMRKRKKEKENLAKLGKLVPIDTKTEENALEAAASTSRALPLPLRMVLSWS